MKKWGKMNNIICRILKEMVKFHQWQGRDASVIYLGENEYEQLFDLITEFGIGIKSKFVLSWFNGAELIKVHKKEYLNVC